MKKYSFILVLFTMLFFVEPTVFAAPIQRLSSAEIEEVLLYLESRTIQELKQELGTPSREDYGSAEWDYPKYSMRIFKFTDKELPPNYREYFEDNFSVKDRYIQIIAEFEEQHGLSRRYLSHALLKMGNGRSLSIDVTIKTPHSSSIQNTISYIYHPPVSE